MNNEIIGIAGSLLIIVAFLFKDEKRIRIFDAIGALLFVVYGILIASFSTVFLNAVLIGIQILNIWRLNKNGKTKKGN